MMGVLRAAPVDILRRQIFAEMVFDHPLMFLAAFDYQPG